MTDLSNQQNKPKILLAADHAGFELKTQLAQKLSSQGYQVVDYGNSVYDPADDYVDFVVPLAMNMQQKSTDSRGIILCRNGVGVSMAVNKFKGIRAGLCFSLRHLVSAITDDNINVLALPVDYISQDEAHTMVDEFLSARFPAEERHVKRLQKLKELGMTA